MNEYLEKLHEALAALSTKVQPETDEVYIRLQTRRAKPDSPVPAMPYDLHTEVQALLLGYRSRDGEVAEKDAEIARLTQEKAEIDSILSEIQSISKTYEEEMDAKGYLSSTPGGLEHMGDVWRLLRRWSALIAKHRKEESC